jgi:hypothetical protein
MNKSVEVLTDVKTARMENLTVQNMNVDYIHSQRTAGL